MIDKARTEMLTKTALLKERGWTEGMLKRFLPEPDATKTNPRYRGAASMRLYSIERVAAIEALPEFVEAIASLGPRRSMAKAVAEAKQARQEELEAASKSRLLAYVEGICFKIPVWDCEKLVRCACDNYNAHQRQLDETHWDRQADWCLAEPAMVNDAPEFMHRLCVNYLRHRQTPYDRVLQRIGDEPGASEVCSAMKCRTLTAIAEAYPFLSGECERQRTEAVALLSFEDNAEQLA